MMKRTCALHGAQGTRERSRGKVRVSVDQQQHALGDLTSTGSQPLTGLGPSLQTYKLSGDIQTITETRVMDIAVL